MHCRKYILKFTYKIAKVIQVFKKSDSTDIAIYRPIFLVPILGKAFERVMKDQILKLQLGVPQKSVLGPNLFLIFTNNLYLCTTDTEFDSFADG